MPAEKVILNPSLSGEDSEVITDIGGMLLMFGLQDNEFALPQALSFWVRESRCIARNLLSLYLDVASRTKQKNISNV